MSDKRTRPANDAGRTSEFPIVPEPSAAHEPPMPQTLPELNALDGVTGRFRIVPEGEDKARQKDDSATRADSAPAPKARTSQ